MEIRYIVRRMKQLNMLHRIRAQGVAGKLGLHFGQLPILEYIRSNEKCAQRDLAQKLQVSPPSIATSVKRMQKAGLIEKTVDEKDLRYNKLTVTEKGIAVAEQCRLEFDQIDGQMLQDFSEEEKAQFYRYVERMIENLAMPEWKDKSFFALVEKAKKMSGKTAHKEDKR